MRPDPPIALQRLAHVLLVDVAPQLGDAFAQQTAGLAATLAAILAEEWDRSAARLLHENTALRRLFARASSLAPSNLSSKLREAANGFDTDFSISRLQATNDALRQLLIELHAWTEQSNDPRVVELNEAIWEELKESTRRRHLATRPL